MTGTGVPPRALGITPSAVPNAIVDTGRRHLWPRLRRPSGGRPAVLLSLRWFSRLI
ncbi:MAG TPA: hypothetical protein VIT42_18045 [Microlunatus sp.]